MSRVFSCAFLDGGVRTEAAVEIAEDRLSIRGEQPAEILYADLKDLRLLDYRLQLYLTDRVVELSQLGYETETFFENLWEAYDRRCLASLFIAGESLFESEGDYAYTEPEASGRSIAKLILYPDCLAVLPHDRGARRVPLCFAREPVREGFFLTLSLDTGERYQIGRLGRDTEDFFGQLETARTRTVRAWEAAHRELSAALPAQPEEIRHRLQVFESLGGKASAGLFAPGEAAFWFAVQRDGRAAVELVLGENTAVYLYRYTGGEDEFLLRLRHAMEAVRDNRRLIYLPEEELQRESLYRMAVERSRHVRFLREAGVGRVIHTGGWEGRLRSFFEA